MENPIEMDDLGVPLFSETPIYYPPSNLNMEISISSMSTTSPKRISFHQPFSLSSDGSGSKWHVSQVFQMLGFVGRVQHVETPLNDPICLFPKDFVSLRVYLGTRVPIHKISQKHVGFVAKYLQTYKVGPYNRCK